LDIHTSYTLFIEYTGCSIIRNRSLEYKRAMYISRCPRYYTVCIIYHFVMHRHCMAFSIAGSRLDYCNSVLYGAPKASIAELQRVQNMLARVVLNKPRRSHSAELLQSLHWFPVKERIDFKVALYTNYVGLQGPQCIYTGLLELSPDQSRYYKLCWRRDHKLYAALELLVLQHAQCAANFLLKS